MSPVYGEDITKLSLTPECSQQLFSSSTLFVLDQMSNKNNANEETLKKYEKKIDSFSVDIIKSCDKDFFINNLSNKILYLVFGDSIITSLRVIVPIVTMSSYDESDFKEISSLSTVVESSHILITFAKIISYICMFIIAIVYAKHIISLRNGVADKAFVMNNIKILTGLSLLTPLAILGELSPIQFISIFLVVLGTILANIVWVLSIFVIEFFVLLESIDNQVAKIDENLEENIQPTLVNLGDNIVAHMCEMSHVESAFNVILSNSKSSVELESSNLYACLTKDNNDLTILENKYPLSPKRFLNTRFCFSQEPQLKSSYDDGVFCGEYKDRSNTEPDIYTDFYNDKFNEDISERIRESAKLLENEYQNKVRSIAVVTYEVWCNYKNKESIISDVKPFDCIKQGSNYDYSYDIDEIPLTMSSDGKSEEMINASAKSSISEAFDDHIKFNLLQTYLPVFFDISDKGNTNLDVFVSNLAFSLTSGWLGTPSIYISTVELDIKEDVILKNMEDVFEFEWDALSLWVPFDKAAIIDRGAILNTISILKTTLSNEFKETYAESKQDSSTSKKEEKSGTGILSYFSLWNILKTDAEDINTLDDVGHIKSCYKNTSPDISDNSCAYSNINPLKNIVSQGKDLASVSSNLLLFSAGASALSQSKADKEKDDTTSEVNLWSRINGLSEMLSSIFGVLTAIGIFFGYGLPMIPYVVFASLVIGWMIQAFKTVLVSQFLVINYFIPSKEDDMNEDESKIYKLLINTALSPFFIIMGAVVSFLLIHVSIGLINVSFSMVIEFLNSLDGFSNHSFSLTRLFDNMIVYVVYLIMMTALIIKSSLAMYKVPETLREWFSIDIEKNERMFDSLKDIFRRITFMTAT
jgi:hypothetical protein